MPGKPSRRDLLKTGAIATAGIGALLAPHEPAEAAVRIPVFADVVVVGAGYAGLAAAWELHERRKRVIVGGGSRLVVAALERLAVRERRPVGIES